MRSGVGLTGDAKIENSGIPECITVVQSLKNLQQGKPVQSTDATASSDGQVPAAGDADGQADLQPAENEDVGMDVLPETTETVKDPVILKAEDLSVQITSGNFAGIGGCRGRPFTCCLL